MYDVSVWSLKLEKKNSITVQSLHPEEGHLHTTVKPEATIPAAARRNAKWRKTKPSDLDNPKSNRALQSFLGTMGENRFPV